MPDVKVKRKPRVARSEAPAEETFLNELQKHADDICKMYERGAIIEDLERKYPLFDRSDIIHLIHSRYKISDEDLNLIGGIFMRAFQRNLGRLDDMIADYKNDPDVQLDAIRLLMSTLDRAAHYKTLLSGEGRPQLNLGEGDSVVVTFQRRVEQRLQEVPPHLKQFWVQDIKQLVDSGAPKERLEEYIEAEFDLLEQRLAIPEKAGATVNE